MEYRPLGRTDMTVSAISFGAWAIGSAWGPVDDTDSLSALNAAVDAGMNFIDTADVYGDGHSERLIARLRRERRGQTMWVATKAGRRLPEQTPEGYNRENLTSWVERSLRNLEMEAVDLLQLHCPHPGVYDRPEVFGILDDLVRAGKIRYYGVSVETFSGVPYEVGLQSVERLRSVVPEGATLAQLALRWILMFDAVSCAIPGAKTAAQARDNAAAADLPGLSEASMAAVRTVYDELIRSQVHSSW